MTQRRVIDVDITDRADGKVPIWDSGSNTHVYEAPSGVPAGTSFPGTPSTSDLFWRTDRALLYYYDGTRWLTVNEYTLPVTARTLNGGISVTSTMGNMTAHRDHDMYITRVEANVFVASGGTALGASHKWVVTFAKIDSTNGKTTISTLTLDSGSSNAWRELADSPAHVVASATYFSFEWVCTKTGTPGNLFPTIKVSYRLVG